MLSGPVHTAVAWSGFGPPWAGAVPPALQPELGSTALPQDAQHGLRGENLRRRLRFA